MRENWVRVVGVWRVRRAMACMLYSCQVLSFTVHCVWSVGRRVHARAGMTQLVARRLVSVVHGACTTMRASSLAAMLHASFVSKIVVRSVSSNIVPEKACIQIPQCHRHAVGLNCCWQHLWCVVSDIAIFVLKRDVKLQLTN